MLVLSRKKNESIQIGDLVRVMVIDIRGDKVRLGIEAPAEVPVHRREVWEVLRRYGDGGPDESAPETGEEP